MAVSFRLLSTLSLLSALGFVTLSPAVAQTLPTQGGSIQERQLSGTAVDRIMSKPPSQSNGGSPSAQKPKDSCSAEIDPQIAKADRKVQALLEQYRVELLIRIDPRNAYLKWPESVEQLTERYNKKLEDALCELVYWQNMKNVCQELMNQQNKK